MPLVVTCIMCKCLAKVNVLAQGSSQAQHILDWQQFNVELNLCGIAGLGRGPKSPELDRATSRSCYSGAGHPDSARLACKPAALARGFDIQGPGNQHGGSTPPSAGLTFELCSAKSTARAFQWCVRTRHKHSILLRRFADIRAGAVVAHGHCSAPASF